MTQRSWIALAAGATLAFAAAGALAQTEIKVGLTLPDGMEGFDHVNGMYELFRDIVEERSGGELTVDLVYGGALGAPDDRLNQMRRGVIQMSDAADGNYATLYPDIQVLSIPYLFPDEETAWEVLDGPFGQRMAEGIRGETGIRVFGFWEAGGFRHFSANAPIETPEDMDGMKMRVMGPVFAIPVEAMGGAATPIVFNELYTSLQTGVVDGQDNAVNVFRLIRLYEVQDYLMLDGHAYSFGMLGMNDAFFQGLTEELQAIVEEAAAEALDYNRETSRAVEAEALEFLQEEGVTIVEFTPEMKRQLAEITQPAVVEWLEGEISDPALIDDAFAAVDAASGE